MKAVVIGPGRVGCGFAGQLLHASGYEVVFVSRNETLVKHFNQVGRYRVRLAEARRSQEILVTGIRAIWAGEPDHVAGAIAEADLVATAVGAQSLPEIAPLIAAGLAQRRQPTNVLAFENLIDVASYLFGLIMLTPDSSSLAQHGLSGALVSRAVTQRIGDPAKDEPLLFVGDPPATFVVDGLGLRPPLPKIDGMSITENYPAMVLHKLYTFSAGHATTAYLGALKGYHYIHSAIRDAEIRAAALAAMREGQRGLAACYGPELAGDQSELQQIVARFENAALNDPIARVCRDPRRKLGADERLVGAARLAEEAGILPHKLALAAAAALCFSNPSDPSAAKLRREIETMGPEQTLRRVSGLDPDRGVGKLVAHDLGRLSSGQCRGNLLLSLEKLIWSWTA